MCHKCIIDIVVLHNVNTRAYLEANNFTEGWTEVKALHPTLNMKPREAGRGNGTERIMQATEEDGKTLILKITKDHEDDCFLTLGRPTHEVLPEEGEDQVEEQDEEEEDDQKDEGPTAEQTAAMNKAYKDAMARQEEEEEPGGRGKRARKKPQAEEESSPAKSPKKSSKGKSSKGGKGK